MRVGLIDVDSHNFPNLCLMKLSEYHTRRIRSSGAVQVTAPAKTSRMRLSIFGRTIFYIRGF